jgi:hypothetical protein
LTARPVPGDVLPTTERIIACHELRLQPVPRAVADTRRFLHRHCPDLPIDVRDALLLLASELVTNAVLHARTAIHVTFMVSEHYVAVAVHDLDLPLDTEHLYPNREGGWGLSIVRAVADAHGMWRADVGGKTAWFRLSRSRSVVVPDATARRTRGGAPSTERVLGS